MKLIKLLLIIYVISFVLCGPVTFAADYNCDVVSENIYLFTSILKMENKEASYISSETRRKVFDNKCMFDTPIDLMKMVEAGVPLVRPNATLRPGDKWRRQLLLKTKKGDVPLSLIYTLERVDKMFGDEVVVVSLMLSGVESLNGLKQRWAGIGREIWDLKTSSPVMRVLEVKRGTSFIKNVDLKLSYSEVRY